MKVGHRFAALVRLQPLGTMVGIAMNQPMGFELPIPFHLEHAVKCALLMQDDMTAGFSGHVCAQEQYAES